MSEITSEWRKGQNLLTTVSPKQVGDFPVASPQEVRNINNRPKSEVGNKGSYVHGEVTGKRV